MTTYAIFKCPESNSVFKVVSGGAGNGPGLMEYSDEESDYNYLNELDVRKRDGEGTADFREKAILEGMRIAAIHCPCEPREFTIEDTDSSWVRESELRKKQNRL